MLVVSVISVPKWLVWELWKIIKPSFSDILVFEEFAFFLVEIMNGHFFLWNHIGVLFEELLAVWFEDIPRRIRDNGVETATVHDLRECECPMEWGVLLNIFKLQGPLIRFARLALFWIPCGLLILDLECIKVRQEHVVECFLGSGIYFCDTVSKCSQIFAVPCSVAVCVKFVITIG